MKNIKFILIIFFLISIISKTNAYEGHGENLGREGPPPAGPYKLGFKELERAIKIEKKGKLKKAKIKFEKALDYFLKANAEDPANPDILNYLGLCSAKLGFDENAEIYYLLGLELNDQHNSIKYNLGVFYKNQNRISDTKEILNSLKNCECEEYENLKMQIN
tara:strand:+ start:2631 stop:3116 length:486 start_codon:yes stop_codon:yes gene_type:complete